MSEKQSYVSQKRNHAMHEKRATVQNDLSKKISPITNCYTVSMVIETQVVIGWFKLQLWM